VEAALARGPDEHSILSSTLTPCRRATQKCVITVPCVVDGSRISAILRNDLHMRFTLGLAHLSLQSYLQLDAGCLGVKLQTNRPVLTPIFRTIRLQRHYSFRYSFCFPSVAIMALCGNVLQEDDILCVIFGYTF